MKPKRVAIVAYDGFNELDVFANLHVINRASRGQERPLLTAELYGPRPEVRTMYGVNVAAVPPVNLARHCDAVFIGSGGTLRAIEDKSFMDELRLDPTRQLVASQCSGALELAHLGLLGGMPVCTDALYRPRLQALGLQVLDEPFHASGNMATAGGCFAAAHLSSWIITRLLGLQAAARTLRDVAPAGAESSFVDGVLRAIGPFDGAAPPPARRGDP